MDIQLLCFINKIHIYCFCVCVKRKTLCNGFAFANCLLQLSSSCDSALRVPNIGEFGAKTYCVCVKRITLCNCLCSSSCGSASVIRNFGKFGAKNYFTGHQAANTIHGFRDSVTVLKIHGCY